MNSLCIKSFESVQTTCRPALLGSYRQIQCVSKVSNLFVDQHYKVVSHEFDLFRKFQPNHKYTSIIR